MLTCCHHDWVDILAALGPTLATVFAGIATIMVYIRGERFQRRLVRPLLVVKHKIRTRENFTQWIVLLKNEGQVAANIDVMTVVAGAEIMAPKSMQPPDEYWTSVLYACDVFAVQNIRECHTILTPFSIRASDEVVLFDATLRGPRNNHAEAIKKLEIRVKGESALGEPFVIHRRFFDSRD